MTDTQKDELFQELEDKFGRSGERTEVNPFVTIEMLNNFILAKIEEAEKRGRENISIGVLQSIENLYKLWSPEPIPPSSPINQFIRELQDLVLKSNLADK